MCYKSSTKNPLGCLGRSVWDHSRTKKDQNSPKNGLKINIKQKNNIYSGWVILKKNIEKLLNWTGIRSSRGALPKFWIEANVSTTQYQCSPCMAHNTKNKLNLSDRYNYYTYRYPTPCQWNAFQFQLYRTSWYYQPLYSRLVDSIIKVVITFQQNKSCGSSRSVCLFVTVDFIYPIIFRPERSNWLIFCGSIR